MRALLLLFVSGGLLQPAIIHGIILEQISSRPLSRTRVRLQRITSEGSVMFAQAMTNRAGQYWFPSLPDGRYMVTAARIGFADASYGQKKMGLPGVVVAVEGNGVVFAEIKMRHLGGVSGKVLDENAVGMPGVNVIAYPTSIPLRMLASAKTDDRGNYRLGGLLPGNYWVRSGPMELEDGSGVLPTFYPLATGTQDAKLVRVDLDVDAPEVDIQPLPGKLFRLKGSVRCSADIGRVRVTLSVDTGRKEAVTSCPFGSYSFDQLAPGNYEVLGEPLSGDASVAAWIKLYLDRDNDSGDLLLVDPPQLTIGLQSELNTRLPPDSARVLFRRRDPAGETHSLVAPKRILPGIWEIFVDPQPSFAFTRFSTTPMRIDRSATNENSLLIELDQADRAGVNLHLSSKPAVVEGVVRRSGDPVPGVPYWLLAVSPAVRRLTHGMRSGLTDDDGKFRVGGLPPGTYLVISSFELEEVNQTVMQDCRALAVTLKEGSTQTVSLDLFVR